MNAEEIINKINSEAERQGLSRYRIAKISGFSDAQIKHWLEGSHEPSLSKLVVLCHAVGLTIELKPLQ